MQHRAHAGLAERALEAADHRLRGGGRQRGVAMLAGGSQLQHVRLPVGAVGWAAPMGVHERPARRAMAWQVASRLACNGSARVLTAVTTSPGAVAGVPLWNGGCGSYSNSSWICLATSSPRRTAARCKPKSIPAVTPPPVMRMRSTTMRAAPGDAPRSGSKGKAGQCVVAREPLRQEAAPYTSAPAHTGGTYFPP